MSIIYSWMTFSSKIFKLKYPLIVKQDAKTLMMYLTEFLQYTLSQPEQDFKPQSHAVGHCTIEHLLPGVLCMTPKQADINSEALLLSAGVHGNETAPIEMLDRIIAQIAQGIINVSVPVMFQFGNLTGIRAGVREVKDNMNRLFSGAHTNYTGDEADRAMQLEQVSLDFFKQYQDCKLHLDLHCAIRDSTLSRFAIYPYQADGQYQLQAFNVLKGLGLDGVLLHNCPTTTYSYFSQESCKAMAFTVELGKAKPFGTNNRQDFAGAEAFIKKLISNGLTKVINQQQCQSDDLQVYKINREINKQSDQCQLNFANDVCNFTEFNQGELLSIDTVNTYAQQGEAIIFPNAKVAVGQRIMLLGLKYSGTPLQQFWQSLAR
ncbi:succinylglutamate desuccinylase [Paraferrimonas sp. SM1919]|uniref:succinylglutamate desuccinylase n=1 Tax=Paraferrimonas sp. SM1919 TaxID=2662263 RepID=UPI0013D4ECF9|nr:succinylglutamate desuccinylase [Paraferrimonas sp. SM1919]